MINRIAYKQRNQIGRFAPKDDTEEAPELPEGCQVGARCEEKATGRRGQLKYVGVVPG